MIEKILGKLILIQRAFGQWGFGGQPSPQTGVGGQPGSQTGIGGQPGTGLPNPLGVRTIEELLQRIVNYLIIIAIPLASIMIIWGAFQILFAGGNPEKVATGRRTIVYAAVGLAIILSASGIIIVIKELLGAKP